MVTKRICGRAGSLLVVLVDDAQGRRAVLALDESRDGMGIARTLTSIGGRAYVSSLIEALRVAEEELAKR